MCCWPTKRGTSSSSSIPQVEEPDDLATHYQVNTQSAALLTETADAGEAYLNDTLFLGIPTPSVCTTTA